MENITEAAKRRDPPTASTSTADGADSHNAQQHTAGSGSNALSLSSHTAAASAVVSQQQVYQQLCAVILLQFMNKVLSLPDQESWSLMSAYQPSCDTQLDGQACGAIASTKAADASCSMAQCDNTTDLPAAATSALASSSKPAITDSDQQQQQQQQQVCWAAVPDEDEDIYEDMHTSCNPDAFRRQQQQHASSSSNHGSLKAHAIQSTGLNSWQQLRHRILQLGSHMEYAVVADDALWSHHNIAQQLLQLIRSLGVHENAHQLQPLLHIYVSVLIDYIAAVPSQVLLLDQLWDALGIQALSSVPAQHSRGRLPSDCLLALSVAVALWQQLKGTTARSRLWHNVHNRLMCVIEHGCEQLAYVNSNMSGEDMGCILLLAQLIEMYVMERPRSSDAGVVLIQTGVLRSLVQLFVRHATAPAAEPLRYF